VEGIVPRKKRLVLPNCPHHVLHRGHDGEAVFVGDDDYRYYLDNLRTGAQELGCKVYAYCLLLSKVHLIVDPGVNLANLGRLMKIVAGRQAGYAKRRGMLNGVPLWERRFRSSPIVAGEFLLACSRYVELGPVRACLANNPDEYIWSSCRAKLGLDTAAIHSDPAYLALGQTATERAEYYRLYMTQPVPHQEWAVISHAVQTGTFTGLPPVSADEHAEPVMTALAN
jgi:putative transposase